jgi:hypothetical protein
MAKAPRLGNIFELKTPKGFAYFQNTYKDDKFGHLIRILPGLYDTRPTSFSGLNQSKELYFIFFPLGAAVSRELVKYVADEPIPAWAQKPPIMRRAGGRSREGKVQNWFIPDGNGEKLVVKLNDEQKHFSLAQIWNDTMLIERICSGWLPENDI